MTGPTGPTGPTSGITGPTGAGSFTGPTGPSATHSIIFLDFTASFGVVPKNNGVEVTQLIAGLLTTDQVYLTCISTPPAGFVPPNARVSAADTMKLFFTTTKTSNLTLGSLNWRLTIFR